jgi:hypothetical protein
MTRRPVTVPPDVPGALGRAMTVVGELGGHLLFASRLVRRAGDVRDA